MLSSLFSPGAIAYKEQVMPKDSVISMSVGCVVMVDAETSGVMYSADPADLDNNAVVINANFGLGKTVVDGSVDADHYLVNRDGPHDILYKKIGKKDKAAIRSKDGGIEESYLPEEKRNGQCLSEEQMKKWEAQKAEMGEGKGKCPYCKKGEMCEKCKAMMEKGDAKVIEDGGASDMEKGDAIEIEKGGIIEEK